MTKVLFVIIKNGIIRSDTAKRIADNIDTYNSAFIDVRRIEITAVNSDIPVIIPKPLRVYRQKGSF